MNSLNFLKTLWENLLKSHFKLHLNTTFKLGTTNALYFETYIEQNFNHNFGEHFEENLKSYFEQHFPI